MVNASDSSPVSTLLEILPAQMARVEHVEAQTQVSTLLEILP